MLELLAAIFVLHIAIGIVRMVLAVFGTIRSDDD